MHKFFTEDINDGVAVITGEDVRHAYKVLRIKPGEMVEINNLNGSEYIGEVDSIDRERVTVKITGELSSTNESPLEIVLFQGIPKGQKMELICQKVCELGCSVLVPLITERVVPDAGKEYKKLDRIKRIIFEASKQSKRSRIMEITEPTELKNLNPADYSLDLLIVPYENAEGDGLKCLEKRIEKSRRIGVVVGPEGGFEESEIEYIKRLGGNIVTLGPRILRTETAGMAVISVLQYLGGDFGGKI